MSKNLISIQDFSKEEILHVLDVAKEFEKNRSQDFLSGKVVACLFSSRRQGPDSPSKRQSTVWAQE